MGPRGRVINTVKSIDVRGRVVKSITVRCVKVHVNKLIQ